MGGLTGTEGTARADEVSSGGKGIVGGGLLGADVVTGTMGIIGVHNPWFYVIGGGVGAAGGAVGGFAVQQASGDGRAPMYLLAGGLALLIPAAVLTLDATRFRPSDDATEDKAPTNGPPADPGRVGGSAVSGPNGSPALAPPSAGTGLDQSGGHHPGGRRKRHAGSGRPVARGSPHLDVPLRGRAAAHRRARPRGPPDVHRPRAEDARRVRHLHAGADADAEGSLLAKEAFKPERRTID